MRSLERRSCGFNSCDARHACLTHSAEQGSPMLIVGTPACEKEPQGPSAPRKRYVRSQILYPLVVPNLGHWTLRALFGCAAVSINWGSF